MESDADSPRKIITLHFIEKCHFLSSFLEFALIYTDKSSNIKNDLSRSSVGFSVFQFFLNIFYELLKKSKIHKIQKNFNIDLILQRILLDLEKFLSKEMMP